MTALEIKQLIEAAKKRFKVIRVYTTGKRDDVAELKQELAQLQKTNATNTGENDDEK
jgi:hypothetical protein